MLQGLQMHCAPQALLQRPAHENHEAHFMIIRYPSGVPTRTISRDHSSQRGIVMKWETPQATEFRFGMEITMYIANR